MLKLDNIKKEYVLKDQEPVHALKGISLSFRKNEFVAILGPSGCGKTTLLNITGGLDRYTSGDLIIENKSTKNFKDSDWDNYRNHSIGFVFQTYNLISHQSVLKNVELALTISGVSKKERKLRSIEALEKVGLKGMERKKPNQMSGGQMQRVAIARALVNNPEIVLADEPTGALDSETSVQIMELLKEVAKDRLVIMVTHNPELAEKYATRIVNMKDGLVIGDSNPFDGVEKKKKYRCPVCNNVFEGYPPECPFCHTKGTYKDRKQENATKLKGKKQASMSFFTAMGLSFSNLVSKMKRMVLVTIAGSIGIIGVSAVLAVSQGVRDYIGGMQDDMLSSYPVTIAEESVDVTSLLSGLSTNQMKQAFKFDPDNPKVGIDSMVEYLMTAYSDITNVKTNTISHELVDYIKSVPSDSISTIYENFGIDPTNSVFTTWTKDYLDPKESEVISLNGLTQRYIAELNTVDGFKEYASYVDLFTSFMKQMPGDSEYILSQYDLLGNSEFKDGEKDLMLVVDNNHTLTDLTLAQMGFFNHDEFINIAKQAIEKNKLDPSLSPEEKQKAIEEIEKKYPYRKDFSYEELIGKELYYFPQDIMYSYSKVAESETSISIFLIDISNAIIMSLAYKPNNDTIGGTIIKMAGSVSYEQVNFIRDGSKPETITEQKEYVQGIWKSFNADGSLKYTLDCSKILTMSYATFTEAATSKVSVIPGSVQETTIPVEGFNYQAEITNSDMLFNPENYGGYKMKIGGILKIKENRSFGCLDRGVYYGKAFGEKYISDSNKDTNMLLNDENYGFKKYIGSDEEKTNPYKAYVKFDYLDFENPLGPVLKHGYANSLNGDMTTSFSDLFSSLTGVNYYEQDKVHFRSVCGYKIIEHKDESDPETITYSFDKLPQTIKLYPKDFASKDKVTNHLDVWNKDVDIKVFVGTPQEKTLTKKDRPELTYTDTVKLIITVINTLVTSVTVALVAFTSLALVVSCFMIAVITYISVVERVKEIGIIRSVGGRKKDVSRLFIAETFMTGLSSGVFGIAITYLFQVVFNIAMYRSFKLIGLANLTVPTAIIMIAVSIILSVVSGLIPSMKASRQDPVIALRSE